MRQRRTGNGNTHDTGRLTHPALDAGLLCFSLSRPLDRLLKVCRFHDGRERNCALARAECARNLKKAREEWMRAEKVSEEEI